MPKRTENGYFALVVTCVVCLLAIALVALTFSFSKGYQSADQEHSAYYAKRDHAEMRYHECLKSSASLDSARECINNAEATTRDSERAEKDLNAQREMAQWAEGMLWAAWTIGFLSLTVTLVGIRYVYLTLIATQEMAGEASRIGEAQVRAYLGCEGCAAWEGAGVEFSGTITNCGNSPAVSVYMMLELTYLESIGGNTSTIHEMYTVPRLIGSIPSNGRIETGRISFIGFFGGSRGGTFDVRFANLCLLGQDVFGREISYFGTIGYFQSFDEYSKKKVHPSNLSPADLYGNRSKSMQSMREWVANANRHK